MHQHAFLMFLQKNLSPLAPPVGTGFFFFGIVDTLWRKRKPRMSRLGRRSQIDPDRFGCPEKHCLDMGNKSFGDRVLSVEGAVGSLLPVWCSFCGGNT